MPRNWIKGLIVDLMSDGVSRHIHEMYREIAKKEPQVTESQVMATCAKLANDDEMERVRTGIYIMEKKS